MSARRFFITTAIDYANGSPHLGHALEKIGADVIARYQRSLGRDVHFVMGMDEHGLKVAQTAAEKGISPQAWVDSVAEEFEAAWRALRISHNRFIRTTEPTHARAVEEMIRRMKESGDLYPARYAGHYCVGCEAYRTEEELVEGRCPHHPGREVQWMEEENWFFRLSRYQDRLARLLEDSPEFVQPASRRNEVRRMVEEIKDISVSRSLLRWGIPWPEDPEHTVYVWIDALTNYLTAAGFPGRETDWPADLHVIGKDITRFHCVYWPAMLWSAGLELPRQVWAHGFVTTPEGERMSKSGHNPYALSTLIDRYGTDALRYFLLREVPWDGDGSFRLERFDERYAADLANDLGNLASRTLSMVAKYRNHVVPTSAHATELDQAADAALSAYQEAMDSLHLHRGLEIAMGLSASANQFVAAQSPWALAKNPADAERLDAVLHSLVRTMGYLSAMLRPFMPGSMRDLWARLTEGATLPTYSELSAWPWAERTIVVGAPLFPRADREPQ